MGLEDHGMFHLAIFTGLLGVPALNHISAGEKLALLENLKIVKNQTLEEH